ncbi:transglutaminase family protein [Sagittula sp. NFXS13]|uniref:transglutaminase-like domain-containing protein n=1 Tax=Sagittula sp. NFXS13 TaxID=2819095 RepID=UPI0032DE990C
MQIQIDVALHYRFARANTVFIAIEAAETDGQTILSQWIDMPGAIVKRIKGDSDVGERIWAQVPQGDMWLTYTSTMNVTRTRSDLSTLNAAPRHDIPAQAAPYLRPSRYCQSDKFLSFVNKRFGFCYGGARVAAIRDWIEQNLSYVPGASDADTNVLETFASREGVCRDYAHLLCSMVRAAGIPARMAAVYSPFVNPPDFHAVAEVWLDDAWHLVDGTGMCHADDLVVIAVGRDAYDIAFLDSEAPAELINQSVRATITG